jgi:hypothetical protein
MTGANCRADPWFGRAYFGNRRNAALDKRLFIFEPDMRFMSSVFFGVVAVMALGAQDENQGGKPLLMDVFVPRRSRSDFLAHGVI